MTNETAKREIESLDYYLQNHTDDYSEESHTAMMMAIKALETQPSEDCISRQAVLGYAKDTCLDLDKYEDTEIFCDEIKALPTVTPQPKKGKWIVISCEPTDIFKCSECGTRVINPYRYCHNCGTKMEVEDVFK